MQGKELILEALKARGWEGKTALSTKEAAALLGISQKTLYLALESGAIRGVRFGRRWVVPVEALASFMELGGRAPGRNEVRKRGWRR
ncbi:DNA-binding protein, excisionase family [Thermus oshimai JL-2]|uniref:DNA-binding protein, excisionase family n=1 Tax=Thermus oshimai JL-2 TaxID=751945 RepID=K7QXV3_THEOS|nr:helix-turn-helix domain-containing protein [Thermus oshimai]AFV76713.1 DNA-binding protein, excisionase family [Thermus oshimai JL-2]